ncbi:MAG: hypothetical protein SW833_15955 [Cyanobacteriota bacterium]|nr:hypothetical protein [Cyanobacteriota bacterium]
MIEIAKTNNPELYELYEELNRAFSEAGIVSEFEKMRAIFDRLLRVKKGKDEYYGISAEAQDPTAASIAIESQYNFLSAQPSIEELRQKLLDFQIEISSRIRNSLPEQYNALPSELDDWSGYDPGVKLNRTDTSSESQVANSPAMHWELPEFG